MERKQVLLTGGIGSGKSTVGRLLAQRGACVIDADLMGHAVLEPDGEAFTAVAAAFPSAVVDDRIDRSLLAASVFADPARLRVLESLTHPAIRTRIEREVNKCKAPVVVVEVPFAWDFMGEGWLGIVVEAPEAVRLRRLAERGMDLEDAKRRMRAQPTRRQWRASADILVDNSRDLADLEGEVDRLWTRVKG